MAYAGVFGVGGFDGLIGRCVVRAQSWIVVVFGVRVQSHIGADGPVVGSVIAASTYQYQLLINNALSVKIDDFCGGVSIIIKSK